jgi:hypothetical protein
MIAQMERDVRMAGVKAADALAKWGPQGSHGWAILDNTHVLPSLSAPYKLIDAARYAGDGAEILPICVAMDRFARLAKGE